MMLTRATEFLRLNYCGSKCEKPFFHESLVYTIIYFPTLHGEVLWRLSCGVVTRAPFLLPPSASCTHKPFVALMWSCVSYVFAVGAAASIVLLFAGLLVGEEFESHAADAAAPGREARQAQEEVRRLSLESPQARSLLPLFSNASVVL